MSILSVYISILIQLKYKELADLDGKGLLLHSTVQLFMMYVEVQLLSFSSISFAMNHIQNHETHQMTDYVQLLLFFLYFEYKENKNFLFLLLFQSENLKKIRLYYTKIYSFFFFVKSWSS